MPSTETNAARATLSKRRADVARMFDHVAHRYDLTNTMMTMGEERRWRQRVVEAVDPRPGQLVLDLAAGTGTSSQTFADRGAQVVAADLSLGMLGVGKQRQPKLDFLAADALSLPFADDSFDTVTITFGLRNVEDSDSALAEMRRVTRPGGRLVVAEFSTPTWTPFRVVYSEYLMAAVPGIARVFSSNPIAYEYLAESIQAWPNQTELAEKITAAGWQRVEWRNLSGGIVAIHRAYA